MVRVKQCVVFRQGRKAGKVLGCSVSRRDTVTLLNRCLRKAHPTRDECDVVPVTYIDIGLGATRVKRAKGKSAPAGKTTFENDWTVETWWDKKNRTWVTQTFSDRGEEIDVALSPNASLARGAHAEAVAEVEAHAEPEMERWAFVEARSGGAAVMPQITPLFGARERRRRR